MYTWKHNRLITQSYWFVLGAIFKRKAQLCTHANMGSQDAGDLLVQAFVLENTDEEFELEMPPTSGHDYLKRVM